MRLNTKKVMQLMEQQTVTSSDLAGRTGLSRKSTEWILHNGFASLDAMERIADVLEVSSKEIMLPDISSPVENAIEFLKDGELATVTFTQGRFKSRVIKLAEQKPDQCQVLSCNKDGSICAHLPVDWIRISPPTKLKLSDEQRQKRTERMRQNRRKREELSIQKG